MTPGSIVIAAEPLFRWDWAAEHVGEMGRLLIQHVELTALAVGIGFAISFPLAIWAHRSRLVYTPVTWLTGVLYTIPSLAVISFLIPVTGLSLTTAVIALTSYTLLILIRNIVAGLNGVPDEVKDAAMGMGFTPRQLLWQVEIPLAVPVIIAGVRIATVSTIGLVTVAALIGRGGFGQFIFLGLQQLFWTPLIIGSVLSVVLAFLAEGLLALIQRASTPWARAASLRVTAA